MKIPYIIISIIYIIISLFYSKCIHGISYNIGNVFRGVPLRKMWNTTFFTLKIQLNFT